MTRTVEAVKFERGSSCEKSRTSGTTRMTTLTRVAKLDLTPLSGIARNARVFQLAEPRETRLSTRDPRR
jgi:hypothetical protein